ncbi:MAG: hypothetical protein NC916_01005, partial [Candidatus Omnitrophica bacterium]|nr:hypothetical protein [Candidatus Omnitrophota bacterium]
IKIGQRVWINFRNKRKVGYIVRLSSKKNIKNLKKITDIIDDVPVLDKNLLVLTKKVSEYYCCSWGQAIETALPVNLRKGRKLEIRE